MQSNKIFSLIAAVALAVSVSAQQSEHDNYVGVNFGGGLNTALYKPANGTQALGFGFDAGVHYGHFFTPVVGLGVGLQFSWANAYATYNWNEVTTGLTHPSNPNTPYNLTTGFNNFVERQNIGVLSIPVEVLFRKSLNDRAAFIGGVGLSLDLPLYGNYIAKSGSYSTTGVFPALGSYAFSDMPEHGFSTYTTTQGAKFRNKAAIGASVIADLGFRVAMNDNWGMYFGLYAGYGFTNLLASAKTEEMIMVNATNSAVIDYRGTFDSNETGKANLLRAGVKIAVDFGWGNRRAELEEQARLADELAAAQQKARQDSIAQAEARAKAIADSLAHAQAEQALRDSLAAANSLQRTTTLELEGLCAVLSVVEVKGTIRKIRITLAGEGSLLACLVVSGAGLIPHQQHGLHTLDGGEHCGSVGHVERVARHTPPLAGGSRLRSHSHVVLGRGIVGVVGQRHGAPSGHANHLVLLRCGIKHTDAEVLSF